MADPAGPLDDPGALLRAARVRQGTHIAMLAASLKVPPAKLEALEAGRFDELPDATFTRALALSVCRALKIDPAPVLAQMPHPPAIGLEKVAVGLNTPFRDRPGSVIPADWVPWRKPVLWAAGALVAGAAAFVLLPPRGVTPLPEASAPPAAPASEATSDVPASAPLAVGAGAASPAASPAAEALASAPAAVDPALAAAQGAVLVAVQPSWIQAVDGGGQVLMSRLMPAGETLELVGTPPIRIKIGNAAGTRLHFRGQPVDLAAATRDNVATVELR